MGGVHPLRKLDPNRAYRGKHAARGMAGGATGQPRRRVSRWFAFAAHWGRVEEGPRPRVALLYDAENMGAKAFRPALAAAQRIGDVRIARAYGSAESIGGKKWKQLVQLYGVHREISGGYRTGKNSADIHLVVDAMDLLAQDAADDFVIASCDSDFAPLALRLREAGKRVHVLGKGNRIVPYHALCDSYQSLTGGSPAATPMTTQGGAVLPASPAGETRFAPELLDTAIACAQEGAHGEPWCDIAQFSLLFYKAMPTFSPKSHSCKNMTAFVRKTGLFELRQTKGTWLIRPRIDQNP